MRSWQWGVLVAAALAGPATAAAADALRMYRVTLDADGAAALSGLGVDLGETGYRPPSTPAQVVFVDLPTPRPRQARDDGARARRGRPRAARVRRADRAAARRGAKTGAARPAAKPETGGDSPNPFYDVFRSYSEPGGIKDEMAQLAAQSAAWPSSS